MNNQENQLNQLNTSQEQQPNFQPQFSKKFTIPTWISLLIIVLAALLAIVFILRATYWTVEPLVIEIPKKSLTDETANWQTYRNEKYGFEVRYPNEYVFEEKNINSLDQNYALLFFENTEEYRLIREGKLPGREGPPNISISIYPNPRNLTPLEWAEKNKYSNFNLSNRTYLLKNLANKEAISYKWEGLYKGETLVLIKNKYTFALTVTYLNVEDKIKKDYNQILSTFKFLDSKAVENSKKSIIFSLFHDNQNNFKTTLSIDNIDIPLDSEEACIAAQKACGSPACLDITEANKLPEDILNTYRPSIGVFDWLIHLKPVCNETMAFINEQKKSIVCWCAYE